MPSDPGVRKPEVDRDPACLFLLQTIGIRAGEREDQRALAVIDVTGCAETIDVHVAERASRTGLAIRCRSRRPRRCPRLPAFFPASFFGLARLVRGPRLRSDRAHAVENLRRSQIDLPALHVDLDDLHAHPSPSRYTRPVFSPRSMCARSTNR